MAITVNRKAVRFNPDPTRVIARYYLPGGPDRGKKIIARVLELSEEEAMKTLNQTLRDFSARHRNITRVFLKHFAHVQHLVREMDDIDPDALSKERKLLIGAYFTHEYSIEAAAFFNPSMVEDPDQENLEKGQKRVIVSFRATGEGHISSLVFRGGVIDRHCHLEFCQPGRFVDQAEIIRDHVYSKAEFLGKLDEMNLHDHDAVDRIMAGVGESFRFLELQQCVTDYMRDNELTFSKKKVIQAMVWLATSHYEIIFSLDTAISERVIFPIADAERNGIEDARFVRFVDDGGEVRYYATYTAYNGVAVLPKLIETGDFHHFKVRPLFGMNASNKGMALFPRRINGRYAMLSRQDGENNYIMYSDVINLWHEPAVLLQEPAYPWEFIQVGNCGSPIETARGWLLLTHGVGTMRRYCIGAVMLDRVDPSQIIAKLAEPLIIANEKEREGYVPNVIYSCGALIHGDELVIPYAMSDYSSGFATVALDELFEKMFPGESRTRNSNGNHRRRGSNRDAS